MANSELFSKLQCNVTCIREWYVDAESAAQKVKRWLAAGDQNESLVNEMTDTESTREVSPGSESVSDETDCLKTNGKVDAMFQSLKHKFMHTRNSDVIDRCSEEVCIELHSNVTDPSLSSRSIELKLGTPFGNVTPAFSNNLQLKSNYLDSVEEVEKELPESRVNQVTSFGNKSYISERYLSLSTPKLPETLYVNQGFLDVNDTQLEGLFIPADNIDEHSEVLYRSNHSTDSNSEDGLSDQYNTELLNKTDETKALPVEYDSDEIFYKIREYNDKNIQDVSSEIHARESEELSRKLLKLTYAKYMNTYFQHGETESADSRRPSRKSGSLKDSKTIKESLEMFALDKKSISDHDINDSLKNIKANKDLTSVSNCRRRQCVLCLRGEDEERALLLCRCRGEYGRAHRSCAQSGLRRCAVCLAPYGRPRAGRVHHALLCSMLLVLLARHTVAFAFNLYRGLWAQ